MAAADLASSLHRAVRAPLPLLRRRQRHSHSLMPARDAMLLACLTRRHATRRQRLQSKLAGVCNCVVTPRFLRHVAAAKSSVHRSGATRLVVCGPVSVKDRQRAAHLSVQRLVAALLLGLCSTSSGQLFRAQRLQAAHHGRHAARARHATCEQRAGLTWHSGFGPPSALCRTGAPHGRPPSPSRHRQASLGGRRRCRGRNGMCVAACGAASSQQGLTRRTRGACLTVLRHRTL